jgi:hypothetical protein
VKNNLNFLRLRTQTLRGFFRAPQGLFPCGAFLEDLWLVIFGRLEYDIYGEEFSLCEVQ